VKKVVVPKPRKPKNYLNNRDLLAEVILSKEREQMTDKLAHMLTMLCARYGKRGNFANYTYNEDMQAYAMMMLVRTWNSFKPEKSNNPFAFFTQCIKNSFIQYLNHEKRHRVIRDEIMVDKGLNPSYTYQLEHEAKQEATRIAAQEAKKTTTEEKEKIVEY
jgi:DNA-directed RNA polymerase specialized sigma subunit